MRTTVQVTVYISAGYKLLFKPYLAGNNCNECLSTAYDLITVDVSKEFQIKLNEYGIAALKENRKLGLIKRNVQSNENVLLSHNITV